MKGTILQLPGAEEIGHISGDDGQRYTFTDSGLKGGGVLSRGSRVDFDTSEGNAIDIFLAPGELSRGTNSRQYENKPKAKTLWFTFNGRAPRYDYWVRGVLVALALLIVAIPLDLAFFGSRAVERGESLFLVLTQLFAAWILTVITIKRLRDMGKSPWLALLVFVPLANIVLWVMVAFVPGTVGPNKYGADPLEA